MKVKEKMKTQNEDEINNFVILSDAKAWQDYSDA